MRSFVSIISLVGLACLIAGCATIMRGSHHQVTIVSEAGTAETITVLIQNTYGNVVQSNSGQVPMTMQVRRPSIIDEPYKLVIQRDGMPDRTVYFDKQLGWGWSIVGNWFTPVTGLTWGFIIDAATGALWVLKPDTITLSNKSAQGSFFQKRSQQLAHRSQNDTLQIFLYDDPDAILSLIQDGQKPIGYLQKVPASE